MTKTFFIAVQQNGYIINYVSEKLKGDKEVAMIVQEDGEFNSSEEYLRANPIWDIASLIISLNFHQPILNYYHFF